MKQVDVSDQSSPLRAFNKIRARGGEAVICDDDNMADLIWQTRVEYAVKTGRIRASRRKVGGVWIFSVEVLWSGRGHPKSELRVAIEALQVGQEHRVPVDKAGMKVSSIRAMVSNARSEIDGAAYEVSEDTERREVIIRRVAPHLERTAAAIEAIKGLVPGASHTFGPRAVSLNKAQEIAKATQKATGLFYTVKQDDDWRVTVTCSDAKLTRSGRAAPPVNPSSTMQRIKNLQPGHAITFKPSQAKRESVRVQLHQAKKDTGRQYMLSKPAEDGSFVVSCL